MTDVINGFIPFGSDDSSVLFQNDLKSLPSNGSMPGAGGTFDDEGFDTNQATGLVLDLSAFDYNSLENACQISFDVTSTAISVPNTDNGSSGTGSEGIVPSSPNDFILSWSTLGTGASANAGRLYVAGNGYLYMQMEWGDTPGTPTPVKITTHGKGKTCRVTISNDGNRSVLYVNGAGITQTHHNQVLPADLFRFFTIGSYRDSVLPANVVNAGVKFSNFLVSNRAVTFAPHPMLSRMVVMGDSLGIMSEVRTHASPNRYDCQTAFALRAALQNHGLRLGLPLEPGLTESANTTIFEYSTAVNGTVFDDSNTAAAPIGDQTAAVIALEPTIVVLLGGTNDAKALANFNGPLTKTEIQTILTALLAAGTTVKKVFIPTTVSQKGQFDNYNAQTRSQTLDVNTSIRSLADWWDTNNPTDTGRVVVVDVDARIGGENADNKYFIGTWNAASSKYGIDLHPSSWGGFVYGNMIGEAIFNNLS